jgi:hypothetical protein
VGAALPGFAVILSAAKDRFRFKYRVGVQRQTQILRRKKRSSG